MNKKYILEDNNAKNILGSKIDLFRREYVKSELDRDYNKTLIAIRDIIISEYKKTGKKLKLDNEVLNKLVFDSNVYGNVNLFRKYNFELYDLCQFIDFSDFDYGIIAPILDDSIIGFMKRAQIPLDPQKIYNRLLNYMEFDGVWIDGLFDNVNIYKANFSGSKGAVINLKDVFEEYIYGAIFKDSIIVDNFDINSIPYADFEDAKFITQLQYEIFLRARNILNAKDRLLYFDELWKRSKPYTKKRNRV